MLQVRLSAQAFNVTCAGPSTEEHQDNSPALWLGALNMTSDSSWDGIELLPYNSQAEALALQHLKVLSPSFSPQQGRLRRC